MTDKHVVNYPHYQLHNVDKDVVVRSCLCYSVQMGVCVCVCILIFFL